MTGTRTLSKLTGSPAISPPPAAGGEVPAASPAAGADASVKAPSAAPADVVRQEAPAERFRALSQGNRAQVALVKQAQADAKLGTPEAIAAFERQTDTLLAWLAERQRQPEHAAYDEFFRSWLGNAAELWLAARPLPTLAARQERYAGLDAAFQASRSELDRALLIAAAKELAESGPRFAPGSASSEVRAALAPAIGHLKRSPDPLAKELARRIEAGEIPFKVTKGGHLGVQYFAMVAVSGITVSNGEVGPDFFALSPPFQAAVLRHEFTHVKQKSRVGGFLMVMGSNLAQRFLALASRLPYVDAERLETLGMRWNKAEQAAYRAEKDFLNELGWGERGLLIPDMGMLVGVDTWLEAGAQGG